MRRKQAFRANLLLTGQQDRFIAEDVAVFRNGA